MVKNEKFLNKVYTLTSKMELKTTHTNKKRFKSLEQRIKPFIERIIERTQTRIKPNNNDGTLYYIANGCEQETGFYICIGQDCYGTFEKKEQAMHFEQEFKKQLMKYLSNYSTLVRDSKQGRDIPFFEKYPGFDTTPEYEKLLNDFNVKKYGKNHVLELWDKYLKKQEH